MTPTALNLTRANSGKTITLYLSTNVADEVRYRVQIDAPYLSIDKPRGTFTKQTTLPIKIDTGSITARDIPGTVTLYTTLGTSIIQLPLHTGLTGHYHGSLRYNGDAIPLGDTRFDLDVLENDGDVSVRVAPEHSMLFPKGTGSNDAAYGFGSLSGDGTVDLTIDHLLDATAGGVQNHFSQPVGRRIVMHLNSTDTGIFDGTFSESIYGLFENPVQTKGAAHLEFMPEAVDPNFTTQTVTMPTISLSAQNLPLSANAVFNVNSQYGVSACPQGPATADNILSLCYNSLRGSILNTTTLYSKLSENCKSVLGLTSNADNPSACGCVTDVACLMDWNAESSTDSQSNQLAQGALAQGLVAPAALVAQEEIVAALRDSVTNGQGITAELTHYDTALAALAPVAEWLMQPGMLEYFRNIPASIAQTAPSYLALTSSQLQAAGLTADVPVSGSEAEPFPIARALARVVQLLVDVNAERQRVASAVTTTDPTTPIVQSQYNSVITYLEAVALLGVPTVGRWLRKTRRAL